MTERNIRKQSNEVKLLHDLRELGNKYATSVWRCKELEQENEALKQKIEDLEWSHREQEEMDAK